MAATARAKAADRQAVLKKLLPLLKKQYKVVVPKLDRPVMETMLHATCLENASVEQAERAYARLYSLFPDLNEARVSSITELEPIFDGMDDRDWRAFRIRSILQYVFEKSFNFELESLKKKTLELAQKQLAKIRHLSSFIRSLTLQQAIGAHLLPIDDAAARVLIWLGLAQPGQTGEDIGEALKGVIRKAEALPLLFAIRCLAVDPKMKAAFDPAQFPIPDAGHEPSTALERLADLMKTGSAGLKPKKPAAEAKPAPSAKPAPAAKAAKKKAAPPKKAVTTPKAKPKAPAKAAAPAKKPAKKS